jgi:hypothetical protein
MADVDEPRVRRRSDVDLRELRGGAKAFRSAARDLQDVNPRRAAELVRAAERDEAEVEAELAQREQENRG